MLFTLLFLCHLFIVVISQHTSTLSLHTIKNIGNIAVSYDNKMIVAIDPFEDKIYSIDLKSMDIKTIGDNYNWNGLYGIDIDRDMNVYVTSQDEVSMIRYRNSNYSSVINIAGKATERDDDFVLYSPANIIDDIGFDATFNFPSSLVVNSDGTFVYLLDNYSSLIRQVEIRTRQVTSIGKLSKCSAIHCGDLAIDSSSNILYVVSSELVNVIRVIRLNELTSESTIDIHLSHQEFVYSHHRVNIDHMGNILLLSKQFASMERVDKQLTSNMFDDDMEAITLQSSWIILTVDGSVLKTNSDPSAVTYKSSQVIKFCDSTTPVDIITSKITQAKFISDSNCHTIYEI